MLKIKLPERKALLPFLRVKPLKTGIGDDPTQRVHANIMLRIFRGPDVRWSSLTQSTSACFWVHLDNVQRLPRGSPPSCGQRAGKKITLQCILLSMLCPSKADNCSTEKC